MKKDENQHFNQCSHEIIYKIKKKIKFITDRPTLIFLAMLVETQHFFFLALFQSDIQNLPIIGIWITASSLNSLFNKFFFSFFFFFPLFFSLSSLFLSFSIFRFLDGAWRLMSDVLSSVGSALDLESKGCWFEPTVRHYFSSNIVLLLA